MLSQLQPLLSLLLVELAAASFAGNLNYRSPSLHHPGLGISIHKVVKRNDLSSPFDPKDLNFTHGVASGDPYHNSVILWTRISPEMDDDRSNVTVSGTVPLYDHSNERYVSVSKAPVCVDYAIAKDEKMTEVVDSGTAWTSSDVDYTVKVEAVNLSPFTAYFYQFTVCNSNNKSPIGRAKTIPEKDEKLQENVKLAVYSCSNYPFGFFNAYGNPVRKDSVDFVIHVGDYTYEYKEGDYGWGWSLGRIPQPDKTTFTLYDYRRRLATYRTDTDLLANHQAFTWIATWDDHEVADNTWKSSSADVNNTEASFVSDGGIAVDQRKMNAVRAYFEWMPIRQVDMDDNLRVWRTFQVGNLFDLIMVDTRNYDRSITDLYWNTDYVHQISNDAGRSLMGSRQENWFYNQLISSQQRNATWRLVGNQIVFSRIEEPFFNAQNPGDYDAWDGYVSNRNRTLQTLYDNNITNTIMLAGDSHASWVSDLAWIGSEEHPYDPVTGAGAIGVEFAGTGVTSPSPIGQNTTLQLAQEGSQLLVADNPELQWQDLFYRGYFELDISYEDVKAEFFGMPTILTQNPLEISLSNFTMKAGENKIARDPTVGGGVAEVGALKGGKIVQTNHTVNTSEVGNSSSRRKAQKLELARSTIG